MARRTDLAVFLVATCSEGTKRTGSVYRVQHHYTPLGTRGQDLVLCQMILHFSGSSPGLVIASSFMACAATQSVGNVIVSRALLRRSNPQLVSRRLLHFIRRDKLPSSQRWTPSIRAVCGHASADRADVACPTSLALGMTGELDAVFPPKSIHCHPQGVAVYHRTVSSVSLQHAAGRNWSDILLRVGGRPECSRCSAA